MPVPVLRNRDWLPIGDVRRPMDEEPAPSRREAVVVLVTEDFFCDRICTTLQAVGREPVPLEPGEDLLERVLQVDCLGVVLDLEDQNFDAPALLRALRAAPETAEWTFQCFCSHEEEERIAEATALGIAVTPRSTFALNLVRKLQEFESKEASDS